MKKNKIIGIAVASLGILFSIGGAFALYTKAATPVSFHITPGTYAGSTSTVDYLINGTGGTGSAVAPVYADTGEGNAQKFDGTGLNEEYSQIKYEFTLGADYANDVADQDYVVGNIKLEVKNIPSAFQGNLTIWAGIEGYTEGTLGEHYYASPLDGDVAITNEVTEYSKNANIAVSSAGTQKLVVWLKYTFGEGHLDTMTLDEVGLGYTLSVTWDKPDEHFGKAFVTGNKVMWADDDEYVMLPNINKPHSEGWEWIYNNLAGDMGEAKCHDPAKATNSGYSAGNNAVLTAGHSYNVYWNGEPTSAATFTQIA